MGNTKLRLNSLKKTYEYIYLFIFSLYIFVSLLNITMYYIYLPEHRIVFSLIGVVLIILNCFANPFTKLTDIVWIVLIVISVFLISYVSRNWTIMVVFCFSIAAKGVHLDNICKCFLRVSVITIAIAIISIQLGIIENLSWNYSLFSGAKRYGMGFIYPTDFVSVVFYTVCVFIYLKRNDKFSIKVFILLLFLAYLTFILCYTRLDSLSIVLAAFVYMFLKIGKKKKIGKAFKTIYYLAIPSLAIISLLISYFYTTSNRFLVALNVLVSDRLRLGRLGIERYGFRLLGAPVVMKGYSARSFKTAGDYFYLDCSYLNICLRFGIICLILVCGLFVYLIYRELKRGDLVLPTILVLIGINSMVAHHLFDGYTNVFIFAIFANLEALIRPTVNKKRKMVVFKTNKLIIGGSK